MAESKKKPALGKDRAVVSRTFSRYWATTRAHGGLFALDVVASVGLTGLGSFGNPLGMAGVIDRISAGRIAWGGGAPGCPA